MIRPARFEDAGALALIYAPHVMGTIVTFEEEPVDAAEMARRIEEVESLKLPWLVFETGGAVLGYAYATRWKARSAYRRTVETTIYLAAAAQGRGFGGLLYGALLERLREAGVHAALGGIALPNDASVALHEKLGFEKVGQLREVGWKLGRWVDVGYWELLL
jgi:phosphinothricin acetyltransferase